MQDPRELPAAAGDIARDHPDIWTSYAALGKATAEAGPLDGHANRLVKLALSIGASLEGAVHSHARRALAEGISKEELEHVALLAIPTLGFATGARALTWVRDVTREE